MTGGGAFIEPIIEKADILSLEVMTLDIRLSEVYAGSGIPISVDGVAQVKVDSKEEMIATATEQFLSKSPSEMLDIARQTPEGHLGAILGTMTIEQIYKEREKFGQNLAAAEVERARGLAEAAIIAAKGQAEADMMSKKVEAWKAYNEAAITQMFIEKLPELARAIAEPLSKTEKIVMVSTGSDGIGASKITGDVVRILAQLLDVVEGVSGIKLKEMIGKLSKGDGEDAGLHTQSSARLESQAPRRLSTPWGAPCRQN